MGYCVRHMGVGGDGGEVRVGKMCNPHPRSNNAIVKRM